MPLLSISNYWIGMGTDTMIGSFRIWDSLFLAYLLFENQLEIDLCSTSGTHVETKPMVHVLLVE